MTEAFSRAPAGRAVIRMEGIIKEFPGVRALDNVNFSARAGEVLALVGENGAGKSTLMKILSGIHPYPEYSGNIYINGEPVTFKDTNEAERAGITIIHQELNLFPELSVAENIFINRWTQNRTLIDWDLLNVKALKHLEELDVDIPPCVKLKELTIGKQQMVEIAKALSKNAGIIIFDEPTSALSEGEGAKLFEIINVLKKRGVAVIYISHKMDEITKIADRVAVLRDGSTIGEVENIKDTTIDKIIAKMVGRELKDMYPRKTFEKGELIFEVRNFSVDHPLLPGEKRVDNASFKLHKGEILGIYGLMGAGRTELVCGIFGAFPQDSSGEVYLDGRKLEIRHPKDAIKNGIGLVSENRKQFGLILNMNIIENTTISSLEKVSAYGFLDSLAERKYTGEYINALKIKTSSPFVQVSDLSGGNQQKVVLAKWLMMNPRLLILDEPTRGVDVSAKIEIYNIINKFVEKGSGIIIVSSELPEIMGMSDRVLVMRESRLGASLPRKGLTEEKIMEYAALE